MDGIPFVKYVIYGHACYHILHRLTIRYNTCKYTFPEMYGHNKVITQQNSISIKQVDVVLSAYFILIGTILLHIKLYKLVLSHYVAP